ncbi:MAG: MarR family transcriptional regulator [Spirochaetes bacterium]|nr:MarR family transcriptional regulator [Spirochaetota bacterium]
MVKLGPKRVTELAESFEISLNAVSKHIKYLEKAGLIIRHQKGRDHIITLNPKPLDSAISLLNYYQEFWQRQLNSLENFLNKQSEKGE